MGKSRAAVSNFIRLLSLPPEVREHLEARRLEMGHGRAILALPAEQQAQVARDVVSRGLSVRETEALVRRHLEPAKPPNPPHEQTADVRQLERELSESLGAAVSIEHGKAGKGKLVISYSSLDQLDGVLAHFRR